MKEVTPEAKRYAFELMRLAVDMLRSPFYIPRKKDRMKAQVKVAELIERGWAIAHGEPDPYPPPKPTGEFERRIKSVTLEEWRAAAKPVPTAPADVRKEEVEGIVPHLAGTWCDKCQLYHVAGVSVCLRQHPEGGESHGE